MNELIRVTQLPIIEEHLRTMKADVEKATSEALSLVCTSDTLQTVKNTRSDLSKRFAELEEQRKAVKKAIMAPYEQFEAVYKDCVSGPFKSAEAELKTKIGDVESSIKSACESEMREFFTEMCQAEHVEWLEFERCGCVIDLTEAKKKTHKKLREHIAAFVSGVSQDMTSISTMDGADEILVEYKRSLSLSSAVGVVFERHRRIEEEREAAEARRKAQEADAAVSAKVDSVYTPEPARPLQPPQTPPKSNETTEKVFQMVFTCHGTIDQLKKLKEFMNKEGIKYE